MVIIMTDRGVRARRAARRNGPVENAAVDIAEVVENQIDVDSDLSWIMNDWEKWLEPRM